MPSFLLNRAIDLAMLWNRVRYRRPLLRATVDPQRAQRALLKKILANNANTAFGRQHQFSNVKSPDEYRDSVSVYDYDMLAPYIEQQIDGANALTCDAPQFYARTSGTTGRHKDIPLTAAGIRQVRRAQKQLAVTLWQDTGFFNGRILGIASSAEEGKLRNGLSFGSVSGTTYQSLSPVLSRKFVAPPNIVSLQDINTRYQIFALTVL
ncbi:MAG: GH3 auxin-responsive promoter family protein, partial [Pseudomonadota bacterium]